MLQEGGPDAAEADGQPSQPGQKDLIQRGKADRQKPQVVLTAEPGDGLAKLAWKVLNLPVRTDEQPLRFMIRYGIESEKLTRTIQVGPVQDYVLRELKTTSLITCRWWPWIASSWCCTNRKNCAPYRCRSTPRDRGSNSRFRASR